MAIEQIGLEAVLQDKDFQAGLKRYMSGISAAEGATSKASNLMSGAFDSIQSVGKIALGGIAAAAVTTIGAIATLGPAMISAASDMNESVSKANVVFGDSISIIDKFAATSAESFGIAKGAAYEAAGTFGNLFVTMGLGKGAAADMSVDIVSLASDLASFNNIPIADALQKLRSGLIGEAEPMRSLGVLLTEDAVKAKAMSMGLTKMAVDSGAVTKATNELTASQQRARDILAMYGTNSKQYAAALKDTEKKQLTLNAAQSGGVGPLTESAKLQARYALILEQSKTAQGDFARTSDGLANTQKILTATFKDIQTEIGTAFLPLVLGIAQAVAPIVKTLMPQFRDILKSIMPVLEKIGESIGNVVGAMIDGGIGSAEFYEALSGLVGDEIASSIQNIVSSIQSFISKAQTALAPIMAWISQNVSLQDVLTALGIAIATVVIPAIASIIAAAAPVVLAIAGLIAVVALARKAWENDWGGIREKFAAVWGALQPALADLWNWLQANIPAAMQTLSNIWNTVLLPAFQAIVNFWITTLQPALSSLWDWLATNVPAAMQTLSDFWENTLSPALTALWSFIVNNVVPALTAIWNFVQTNLLPILISLTNLGIEVVRLAFVSLTKYWNEQMLPALRTLYDFFNDNILPVLKEVARVVRDVLGAALNWVKDNILGPFADALATIKGWVDDLADAIRRLRNQMSSVPSGLGGGDGGGGTPEPEFQTGGYVPRTQRALLHGGEYVLSQPMLRNLGNLLADQVRLMQSYATPSAGGNIVNQNRTTTNNLYVTTTSPSENIVSDFGMMQAFAGA